MKLLGLITLGIIGGSAIVMFATYAYDEVQWRAIERRARLRDSGTVGFSNPNGELEIGLSRVPPRPPQFRPRGECA